MKPAEFPEQTTVLAKDQQEYQPLPVHLAKQGGIGSPLIITSCWRLSLFERARILFTGRVWISNYTGGTLQPQLPSVAKPYFVTKDSA